MATVFDGDAPEGFFAREELPLWKRCWDMVLAIANEELEKIKSSGKEIRWPELGFFDIMVTTSKSRGVRRVFRVHQDGSVQLGTKPPNGLVTIVQPQQIELTLTHIAGFQGELGRKLALMCR